MSRSTNSIKGRVGEIKKMRVLEVLPVHAFYRIRKYLCVTFLFSLFLKVNFTVCPIAKRFMF